MTIVCHCGQQLGYKYEKQTEIESPACSKNVPIPYTNERQVSSHFYQVIQTRPLRNDLKCHALSQVTSTQVPPDSPVSVSFSSFPFLLTFSVCTISHMDCVARIFFVPSQTDLHGATLSHFLVVFQLYQQLSLVQLSAQLYVMFRGRLLAYVDYFECLYLEFSFKAG